MSSLQLSRRNVKEILRDPLSLGITLALPIAMLLIFQVFAQFDPIFSPAALAPGIVLVGFVMLMFSAAMILARDRETALFSRFLTAPLRPDEFAAGYTLPYLPAAIVQAAVIYGIAAALGMEAEGNFAIVALVLLLMSVFYIALGMILGALFSVRQVPLLYTLILLLTIFGGAWMDVAAIGGILQTIGDLFPFAHALDAVRSVMLDGAGFGTVAGDVYWVLGYTLVTVVFAVVAFRRRMLE